MTFRHRTILPLAGLLAGAALVVPGVGAVQAAATPRTVIFNISDDPLVKPRTLFLSANAGPRITSLVWRNWGGSTATATGTYIADCASCGPAVQKVVTVTLRRLAGCSRIHAHSYVYGRYVTRTASTGQAEAPRSLPTGRLFCSPEYEPAPR